MILAVVFLDESSTVLDLLLYQVSGLIVVFTALGLIWAAMSALGAVFRTVASSPRRLPVANTPGAKVAATPATTSAPAHKPATDAIPAHTLALITAAVYSVIGPKGVIRSVEVAAPSQTWSMEGRRQIFHSHRVR